jgi:hypothetical protein
MASQVLFVLNDLLTQLGIYVANFPTLETEMRNHYTCIRRGKCMYSEQLALLVTDCIHEVHTVVICTDDCALAVVPLVALV